MKFVIPTAQVTRRASEGPAHSVTRCVSEGSAHLVTRRVSKGHHVVSDIPRLRVRVTRNAIFLAVLTTILASPAYAQTVADAGVVTRWDFSSEETTPLTPHESIGRDQAGPRPPEFPKLSADNTAVKFDSGAYLSVPDPGPESVFCVN